MSVDPRPHLLTWALGAVAMTTTMTSCTDAKLVPIPKAETVQDNKISVTGEVCTTDPDELKFPVKLLFLIDASTSIRTTDPEEQRVDAILEVIDSLADQPDVEYGIIAFGLGALITTERCDDYENRVNCQPGFTENLDYAVAGAAQAALSNGTTDYIIALQTAISMLANDMANGVEEDLENARYVVMFLSDGIPDSDGRFNPDDTCDDAQEWVSTGRPRRGLTDELATLIDQMGDLADRYHVKELSFNGAYLSAPDVPTNVRACSSNLIRAMSNYGGGTFRDFSSGEGINFLFVDFTSFKRVFTLSNLAVSNLNARPFSDAIYLSQRVDTDDPRLDIGIADSDNDGLTDELEDAIGSDPLRQDTDDDGFSDLLEYRLRFDGFDPLDPADADCIADIDREDQDGDGLRNCEERFVGTSLKRYDTDRDGFGDGFEFLYGTNPALRDDLLDIDFDGASNARELRWHSRPDQDDISFVSQHAYRYNVIDNGITDARSCYSFNLSNITLSSTLGSDADGESIFTVAPGLGGRGLDVGENRIILEVSEAPFDNPDETRTSQIACVSARFSAEQQVKLPANGIIDLPKEAFIAPELFDPDVHCVAP